MRNYAKLWQTPAMRARKEAGLDPLLGTTTNEHNCVAILWAICWRAICWSTDPQPPSPDLALLPSRALQVQLQSSSSSVMSHSKDVYVLHWVSLLHVMDGAAQDIALASIV